ncbi:MAG: DsbA family protein [Thermodesulfobacteriota bacterium]
MGKWYSIITVVLVFVLSGGAVRAAQNMEQEVRELLNKHPEILIEALSKEKDSLLGLLEEAARERQQAEEARRLEEERKNPLKPVLEPGRLALGKADAPVPVVEYSDFFCHYCAAGAGVMKELLARHPDDVRVVFKHFATDPLSRKAALYFEALGMQKPDMAWAFQDRVFADQEKTAAGGEAALRELALSLGADAKRLDADLARPELDERVKKDTEEARGFKFRGTPTFVVGGMSIRGAAPVEVFEDAVRRAKEAGKPSGGKNAAPEAKKECTDCREIK